MICRESQRRLSDYIDEYLSPAESLRVERHLMICDWCRSVHYDLTRLVAESRALPELEPSPALWRRVTAEMRRVPQAQENTPGWWQRIWTLDFRFRVTFPQLLGSAAAFLVFVIGLNVIAHRWVPPPAEDGAQGMQRTPTMGFDHLGFAAGDHNKLYSIHSFQQIVDRRKDRWDPKVRMLFERSLASINTSVDECARAISENPDDSVSRDMLDVAYTKKLNLLKDFSGF